MKVRCDLGLRTVRSAAAMTWGRPPGLSQTSMVLRKENNTDGKSMALGMRDWACNDLGILRKQDALWHHCPQDGQPWKLDSAHGLGLEG